MLFRRDPEPLQDAEHNAASVRPGVDGVCLCDEIANQCTQISKLIASLALVKLWKWSHFPNICSKTDHPYHYDHVPSIVSASLYLLKQP